MNKTIWELPAEDMEARIQAAVKHRVEAIHAAGRSSIHGDDQGVYQLYPDGRKEYIKPYEVHKG